MKMDSNLATLISALADLVDINNQDPANPYIVRMPAVLDEQEQDFHLVVSSREPVKGLNYINGIWINLNPTSDYYQLALRLVGLDANGALYQSGRPVKEIKAVKTDEFTRRWEVVSEFKELFAYHNLCWLPGAVKGLKGDKGDPGDQGDDGSIDYDTIVNTAVVKYMESLNN
jgi:hypothetical protein